MCEVIEKAKSLRGSEREVVADLIRELSVIYKERLFAEAGYPSLFVFCTEGLGYSEGAAWRRVEAAKALLIDGFIYDKLRSGELSLCTAATLARVIKPENSAELVQKASGKSHSEVKNIAAELLPPEFVKRRAESVRVNKVAEEASDPLFSNTNEDGSAEKPQAKRSFTVTLELSEEEMQLIEQAQKILSTSKVKPTLLGAVKKVIHREQRLESMREKKRAQNEIDSNGTTASTRKSSSNITHEELSQKNSRYIPADVRHEVQQRDGCRCAFVSLDGRRCTETRHLHFDHKVPFALGGSSTIDNLQLLCPAHNRLEATKVFGAARIASIVQVARNESFAKRSR